MKVPFFLLIACPLIDHLLPPRGAAGSVGTRASTGGGMRGHGRPRVDKLWEPVPSGAPPCPTLQAGAFGLTMGTRPSFRAAAGRGGPVQGAFDDPGCGLHEAERLLSGTCAGGVETLHPRCLALLGLRSVVCTISNLPPPRAHFCCSLWGTPCSYPNFV